MNESDITYYSNCTLCPRICKVDRNNGKTGFCGETSQLRAARAALHFWEEPVISGANGSGTVFFSGCNLRCVFCQNHEIAIGNSGIAITTERLSECFLSLQKQGAHNINLVTGAPFIPTIREALLFAKEGGLSIPIVYNSSGYESVSSLRLLDGLIDVYLPDYKYCEQQTASDYSNAADYPLVVRNALAEMYRQVGSLVLGNDGLLKKGMIVRHLLLPGRVGEAKRILRYLHNTYGESIYISIMNQYTPMSSCPSQRFPELGRKVTDEEYKRILSFAEAIGITNGFLQEGDTASESFIPSFHGEGLL